MNEHRETSETPPADQVSGIPDIDVALDERGLLAEDIDCRTCAYDLRGLSPEGRCPECGTAVGRSIHGDYLRFSDPVWVRQLADGALWLVAAVFVGLGVGILGGVIDSLIGGQTAAAVAGIISGAVGLVGYWKVTAPDPGSPVTNSGFDVRTATRWLAVAGFCGSTMDFFLKSSFTSTNTVAGVGGWIAIGAYGLLTFAGVVASFLMFIVMRRLALRIPNDALARSTRAVMVGMVACAAFALVSALAIYAVNAATGGTGSMSGANNSAIGIMILVAGCVFLIIFLVYGIWWIVLLFKYRSALNSAADLALATWMRHSDA